MKKIESYAPAKTEGILLNANESSLNIPNEIMIELQQSVPDILMNRYPDNDETELLETFGKVIGLPTSQLLAGNGSDQMLGLMIGTFLGKGKTLYTFNPDFSMYDYYASGYEANVKKYPLNEDGTLNISNFIQEGLQANISLVLFSNPNNPTGNCLSPDEIEEILNGFQNIPVIVDEAYIDFSDVPSALPLLEKYNNLYITRTLSKAYGAAGLRVGFLISNADNMKILKSSSVPYALNSVSMKFASIILRYPQIVENNINTIKAERKRMMDSVQSLTSLKFWNSQANFIHGYCENKERLLQLFAEKNIVIRNYNDENTFRITIGLPEENNLVLEVLQKYEEQMNAH